MQSKISTKKDGLVDYYSITKSYVNKLGAKFPDDQEIIIGLKNYKYKLEKLDVNVNLKIEDFEPQKAWYEPNF